MYYVPTCRSEREYLSTYLYVQARAHRYDRKWTRSVRRKICFHRLYNNNNNTISFALITLRLKIPLRGFDGISSFWRFGYFWFFFFTVVVSRIFFFVLLLLWGLHPILRSRLVQYSSWGRVRCTYDNVYNNNTQTRLFFLLCPTAVAIDSAAAAVTVTAVAAVASDAHRYRFGRGVSKGERVKDGFEKKIS